MTYSGVATLRVNGKVVVKAVAKCNGHRVRQLCLEIEAEKLSTSEEIYQSALKVGFGCVDCLVVINEHTLIYEGAEDLEKNLWISTLQDYCFNPYRKDGLVNFPEYVERFV